MPRFYAAAFSSALVGLEVLQGEALFEEGDTHAESHWRASVEERLKEMAKECQAVGFVALASRCLRLSETTKDREILVLCHTLRDLLPDVQLEMTRHLYYLVPASRKSWFSEDDKPLFGEDVAIAIPNSTHEIAEAGRCFALNLERWTAAVFHLMRALELALQKWATDLELELRVPVAQANVQDILNAADKKLVPLTNVCKESKSSPRLNCVESATCESQQ